MYLEPMEMCRSDKLTTKMCVKYMQLPWNIPMVAALNETTEAIVKEGLRENHSLVHQLKNPYARNTKRDLNKRIDTPIAIIAGVPMSWRFLDYIEYMGNPSNYGVSDRRPRDRYHYYLKQHNLHDTKENLVDWVVYYARTNNLRIEAAVTASQGETLVQAFQSMYEAYTKFDKNKLRRRRAGFNIDVTPPDNPEHRIQYILKRYIDIMHLLPPEHIKDAVATMLTYKDIQWLPQENQ